MKENLVIGDRFEGVLLETIKGSSRPRVRPLEYFDENIMVKFPRGLRIDNPIGTRFRADIKVCQKTKDGKSHGKPYLDSTDSSIIKLNYTPKKLIKAIKLNTASDRAYEYIEKEFKAKPKQIDFSDFRNKAYENAVSQPEKFEPSSQVSIKRSDIIKTYALSRADGKCESCENDAPFLKRNGQPYLEVHHIQELSKGGSDSPKNVASLCPNCHARITYGQDSTEFNDELKEKINSLEKELNG